ncbi:hypothetical protein BN871_AA_00040 [Paenibacillus sp. P22]|nr:hypothetical protein BN871_AA_00040 [Paenibacillus sp. P22]
MLDKAVYAHDFLALQGERRLLDGSLRTGFIRPIPGDARDFRILDDRDVFLHRRLRVSFKHQKGRNLFHDSFPPYSPASKAETAPSDPHSARRSIALLVFAVHLLIYSRQMGPVLLGQLLEQLPAQPLAFQSRLPKNGCALLGDFQVNDPAIGFIHLAHSQFLADQLFRQVAERRRGEPQYFGDVRRAAFPVLLQVAEHENMRDAEIFGKGFIPLDDQLIGELVHIADEFEYGLLFHKLLLEQKETAPNGN